MIQNEKMPRLRYLIEGPNRPFLPPKETRVEGWLLDLCSKFLKGPP